MIFLEEQTMIVLLQEDILDFEGILTSSAVRSLFGRYMRR
jgi:hypothetical protein